MWNKQNWDRFKTLARYKNLSPQEQARQYFLHQSNMMYEASLAPASAASSAAGAGAGGGSGNTRITPSTGEVVIIWGQGATNWEYIVMNDNGTVSNMFDTKLSSSDWSYNYDSNVTTDKGISIALQNNSDYSYAILFIQANGKLVNTLFIPTYENYDSVDGRIIYYTYQTNDGYGITHFDGDAVYTHTYSSATNLSFEWEYDGVTTENAFLITVYYGGQQSWRVIKGSNDVEIYNINGGSISLSDYYLYYTANWVYTSTYNSNTSRYESINFFSSDGVLVATEDLTSLDINSKTLYFYGTNKLLLVMSNSDNSTCYIYNFDGTTLTSIQHTYPYYPPVVVTQNLYPNNTPSPAYNPESATIYLFDGISSGNLIDMNVANCDIITKFDGHNFNTYNYANGITASIMIYGNNFGNQYENGSFYNFPTSDSIFNFIDNGDGKVSVLGIKSDGTTFNITDIDDVNISDLNNISYQPFGQWRMIEYRTGSGPSTFQRYKIYDANGNFVANYDTSDYGYANFRPYYDLLYVRSWENLFGLLTPIQVGTTSNTQNYTLNYIPANTYGGVPPTIYNFQAGLTGGEAFGGSGYQYIYLSGNNGGTGSYNQLTGELDLYFGSTPSSGEPIIVAYEYEENFIFNNQNGGTFSSLPVMYYARAFDDDDEYSYFGRLIAPDNLTVIGYYETDDINILTATATSGNIVLPNADSPGIGVGTNYTAFFYQDPSNNDYYTLNLYNRTGLVNSFCVNSSSHEDYFVSGDRYFISTVDNGIYTFNLITPTGHISATMSQYNYTTNDYYWYQNY